MADGADHGPLVPTPRHDANVPLDVHVGLGFQMHLLHEYGRVGYEHQQRAGYAECEHVHLDHDQVVDEVGVECCLGAKTAEGIQSGY